MTTSTSDSFDDLWTRSPDVPQSPGHRTEPSDAPPTSDRLGAAWSGKWWIVGATLLVTVATFVITHIVPKTYESTVQVSVSAGLSAGNNNVTTSNNLAAQYAQVVTTRPVLAEAASATGVSVDSLESVTSSGTVAGQNIIEITMQAGSGNGAEARANAMARSLVDFISADQNKQAEQYRAALQTQLEPLSKQIAKAQAAVDRATSSLSAAAKSDSPVRLSAANTRLNAAQGLLTTLTDRQQNLTANAGLQALAASATAQRLGVASSASVSEPRPGLYTLIAALIALAVSTQLTVTLIERRRRLATPQHRP